MTPLQKRRRAMQARHWRAANPEKAKESARKYRNLNKAKTRIRDREYSLRKRYGISSEDHDMMLAAQGHVCAACGSADPGGKGWQVDHCHSSMKLRGLLCVGCNLALGHIKDCKERLQKLIAYLERQ